MTGFTRSLGKIGHNMLRTYYQCSTSSIRFQTASNNLIGLITVGNVIGTGVTVTNYVIEWRLNSIYGPIQLITGIGSDPVIQSFHPIVSEPVPGGTYYAVIRYIDIDGIRYSPYVMQGQYSPDLMTCLGTINVVTMNCSNGSSSTYSHTISYVNTLQPENNASRSLRFNLNTDGTTTKFAYQFVGFTVADRITVNYVHISDEANPIVLDDWVVGSNATTNYTSSPKVLGSGTTTLKNVLDLTGQSFQSGDYLLFNVTPRYFEPTQLNTNWTLSLKCLSDSQFTCSGGNTNMRTLDPSTVTATWNASLCQWEFSWYNMEQYIWPVSQYTYMQMSLYSSTNGQYDYTTGKNKLVLLQNTTSYNQYINFTGTCALSVGNINIVKSGTSLVYTFGNSTDYTFYKNKYNTLSINPDMMSYTSDDTSINHYKYLFIDMRIAANCGDAVTDKLFYTHWSSPVAFDDGLKTMSITLTNVSNGYPDASCNQTHATINNNNSQVASSISMSDFNADTSSYLQYGFAGLSVVQTVNYQTEITSPSKGFVAPSVPSPVFLNGCHPSDWTDISAYVGGTNMTMGYVVMYNTVKITDVTDPSNNFRITRFFDTSTGDKLSTGVIIYEASLGVRIIP